MSLATACGWCGATFDPGAHPTCPRCGAAAGQAVETTHGGWIETPALAEHTTIQMGRSRARIQGAQNPVLFCTLADGDRLSFGHKNLLWLDPTVRMDSVKTASRTAAVLTGGRARVRSSGPRRSGRAGWPSRPPPSPPRCPRSASASRSTGG